MTMPPPNIMTRFIMRAGPVPRSVMNLKNVNLSPTRVKSTESRPKRRSENPINVTYPFLISSYS